jgi:osmotically inducible protein OsmC
MAERTARAVWQGNLKEGEGTVELGSGPAVGRYSAQSRFESGPGTNPEELLGAAHAACFSMALAANLAAAGFAPERIETSARVRIEKEGEGYSVTHIELDTQATVPAIDENTFRRQAETAKKNCPISRALAATKIDLKARLAGPSARVSAR